MPMTIVRSGGVTTLVALMSAHRAAMDQGGYDQDTVEAIDAYLRGEKERPAERCCPLTEKPRSYN
jgi:hypothetical protein